jgi:hypothetical protein
MWPKWESKRRAMELAIMAVLGLASLTMTALWGQELGRRRFLESRVESAEKTIDLLLESLGEARKELVHHLATMRRDGYTTQPLDQAFEPYRLSPEQEAEIELERSRRAD